MNKLNNLRFTEEQPKNLTYQQQHDWENNYSVLVARHFQYKIEIFLKRN